jgi:heme/copper-type cytochrome/quinol oxidase subunit 3
MGESAAERGNRDKTIVWVVLAVAIALLFVGVIWLMI